MRKALAIETADGEREEEERYTNCLYTLPEESPHDARRYTNPNISNKASPD